MRKWVFHFFVSLLVLKTWISDLDELSSRLKKSVDAEAAHKSVGTKSEAEEIQKLDSDIRSTKLVYKEFKTFLQEFLLTTRDPVKIASLLIG